MGDLSFELGRFLSDAEGSAAIPDALKTVVDTALRQVLVSSLGALPAAVGKDDTRVTHCFQ